MKKRNWVISAIGVLVVFCCLVVIIFAGKDKKSENIIEKVPFDEVDLYAIVFGDNYYNWKAEVFLQVVKKGTPWNHDFDFDVKISLEKVEIRIDKLLPGTGVTLENYRCIGGLRNMHKADKVIIWVQTSEEKRAWDVYLASSLSLMKQALKNKEKEYKKIIPGLKKEKEIQDISHGDDHVDADDIPYEESRTKMN